MRITRNTILPFIVIYTTINNIVLAHNTEIEKISEIFWQKLPLSLFCSKTHTHRTERKGDEILT